MSVMLRSTNPEAVAEIDPHKDRRVPYVGQIVVYHMRPGEGRAGKMSAPAIVTGIEDDDHVEILIIFSADDFMTRWKIPRRTDQNTVNCWSFNEHDDVHFQRNGHVPKAPQPQGHLTWDDVHAMHAEMAAMRNRLNAAEGKLIALETKPKRGRPPKSEAENEIEGAELASELGYEREPGAA